MLKTVVLNIFFLEPVMFCQDSLMNKKIKRTALNQKRNIFYINLYFHFVSSDCKDL